MGPCRAVSGRGVRHFQKKWHQRKPHPTTQSLNRHLYSALLPPLFALRAHNPHHGNHRSPCFGPTLPPPPTTTAT